MTGEQYLDTGGLFASIDGIDPVVSAGTPVGYDLTNLLSESMKARPPWMSLAQVGSNVLYQYVEQNRIALELSRTPENIGRALKITLLKMLGLDWNSDAVTDDNYDSLLNTVSLYLQNHGPGDFINYIGYSLGFSIEMLTLWTQNYKTFFPGPQTPNIIDNYAPNELIPDNGSVWYPTSHVGLLYELFATNAPNPVQIQQLKDIFYRIAPIHIVLEFVGAIITGSIGTLDISLQLYQKGTFTAIAEYIPTLILYFCSLPYEIHVDMSYCQPLHPDRQIPGNFGLYGIETGLDENFCQPSATLWSTGQQLTIPNVTYSSGYGAFGTYYGNVFFSFAPNASYSQYSSPDQGLLIQRTLELLCCSSGNPLTTNWIAYGMTIQPTFTRVDDETPGYNISCAYIGGSVFSGPIATGTDCVVLAFRPTNTPLVSIGRGDDFVSYDFTTNTLSKTSGVGNYGIYPLGSGFYVMWGVMTGSIVAVYPGGPNGFGAIDWLDFQVIQGAVYPAPLCSIGATPDASFLQPQTFLQFNSVIQQLIYQPNVDFGHVDDPVQYQLDLGLVTDSAIQFFLDVGTADIDIIDQFLAGNNVDCGHIAGGQFYYEGYTDFVVVSTTDLGTVLQVINESADLGDLTFNFQLPANTYYFYNGIAEVGAGYFPLTTSIPTSVAGTQLNVADNNFIFDYGVALFTMLPLYPEWTDSTVVIMNILDTGGGLQISINSSHIVITLHDATQTLPLIDGFLRIGLFWTPTNVVVLINDYVITFIDSFDEFINFYIFSNTQSISQHSWLLKNILIMGSESAANLPILTIIEKYTGSLLYNLQHNSFSRDLGVLYTVPFLAEDAGFVSSTINNSVDFGIVP